MKYLIDSDTAKYLNVCNFHGGPATICPKFPGTPGTSFCCPHGPPNFLPWHRLYTVQMEKILGHPIPFWDWTEVGVPNLYTQIVADGGAPIKAPAKSQCPPYGSFVTRNPNFTASYTADLKAQIYTAFMIRCDDCDDCDDYTEFLNKLQHAHNSVHNHVGCDMSTLETAAYDPIFFLHHSFVDHCWAFWQELRHLRKQRKPVLSEYQYPLPPFNLSEYNDIQETLRSVK